MREPAPVITGGWSAIHFWCCLSSLGFPVQLIRCSVGVLVAKRPNVGVEVILDGHGLDASEIVQDDDAGHVHLGKEPTVVWMGRRYMVMDLDD